MVKEGWGGGLTGHWTGAGCQTTFITFLNQVISRTNIFIVEPNLTLRQRSVSWPPGGIPGCNILSILVIQFENHTQIVKQNITPIIHPPLRVPKQNTRQQLTKVVLPEGRFFEYLLLLSLLPGGGHVHAGSGLPEGPQCGRGGIEGHGMLDVEGR